MTRHANAPSYPPPRWRQIIPHVLEAYLLGTVRLDTAGSEKLIPRRSAMVCAFAPHTGWIDSIAIDECFRRAGRAWPVWLTKAENRILPRVVTGDRVICIDQQHPEPRLVRAIHALLKRPNGVLATSLEGTRLGNPDDPHDRVTLGPFKSGAARFALVARVPIMPVVVMGGHRVASMLDRSWETEGSLTAFQRLQRARRAPQPVIVRVLPLYRAHLDEPEGLQGRRLGARAGFHTDRLFQILCAEIRRLDPTYPLKDKKRQELGLNKRV
ncbi:MAG: 1-acyl-sn-glycerol-3-phosphate acyltransferase [Anaerolineae bacterium]|nr:1-acyl-sn-glycerol-3-phosphate acyltransferase [Anaerolineae bacterium]